MGNNARIDERKKRIRKGSIENKTKQKKADAEKNKRRIKKQLQFQWLLCVCQQKFIFMNQNTSPSMMSPSNSSIMFGRLGEKKNWAVGSLICSDPFSSLLYQRSWIIWTIVEPERVTNNSADFFFTQSSIKEIQEEACIMYPFYLAFFSHCTLRTTVCVCVCTQFEIFKIYDFFLLHNKSIGMSNFLSSETIRTNMGRKGQIEWIDGGLFPLIADPNKSQPFMKRTSEVL